MPFPMPFLQRKNSRCLYIRKDEPVNPYEVLGVSETATDEQVRSAYIKLVKKYHPDRYQDSDLKDLANDKLKQVNEA